MLYILYYPEHLKYTTIDLDQAEGGPTQHIKTGVKQDEWGLSVTLAWVVFLYTYVVVITSCTAKMSLTDIPWKSFNHLRDLCATRDTASPSSNWPHRFHTAKSMGYFSRVILDMSCYVPVPSTNQAYLPT